MTIQLAHKAQSITRLLFSSYCCSVTEQINQIVSFTISIVFSFRSVMESKIYTYIYIFTLTVSSGGSRGGVVG
jgi:hypothetical protein